MKKISAFIRKKHRPFCSVVVVASGQSRRMGEDKLFMDLGGVPVLARTLSALDELDCVDEIVVVTRSEKIVEVARLCAELGLKKVDKVVVGGATRAESALAGLSEISRAAGVAAVHDGARPFVSRELTERVIHAAVLYKAAAPAVPLRDTIKQTENGEDVTATPDRDSLRAVQTPQAFDPELIKGALTYVISQGIEITDDCSAVEAFGGRVRLVEGEEENIKLTTPADLAVAEAIVAKRR